MQKGYSRTKGTNQNSTQIDLRVKLSKKELDAEILEEEERLKRQIIKTLRKRMERGDKSKDIRNETEKKGHQLLSF